MPLKAKLVIKQPVFYTHTSALAAIFLFFASLLIRSLSSLLLPIVLLFVAFLRRFLAAPMNNDSLEEFPTMDMDYLLTRCSICYDRSLDFCLRSCRDQFCRPCFSRYAAERVKNSWGVSRLAVTCPVCSDPLTVDEWGRWVDPSILAQFTRSQVPYKRLTRYCPCGTEVATVDAPKLYSHEKREAAFSDVYAMLQRYVRLDSATLGPADHVATLARFQADYCNHLSGGSITTQDIYTGIIVPLVPVQPDGPNTAQSPGRNTRRMKRQRVECENERLTLLSSIGARLVALETDESRWTELQFTHVRKFPKVNCHDCDAELCFHCGVQPYHESRTCHQQLEHLINSQSPISLLPSPASLATPPASFASSPSSSSQTPTTIPSPADVISNETATLEWKLRNSKLCPRCSILINRDDGCNKIECNYCGFKFCYECLGDFDGGKCGFYRCVLEKAARHLSVDSTNPPSEAIKGNIPEPELGVPNVFTIQANFARAGRVQPN